jgi:hypothetical protein
VISFRSARGQPLPAQAPPIVAGRRRATYRTTSATPSCEQSTSGLIPRTEKPLRFWRCGSGVQIAREAPAGVF